MLHLSNPRSYRALAYLYDRFMEEAPYADWVEYAEAEWGSKQNLPLTVVDLACGTGTLSVLLAKAGYQVIGIDLSEEMLAVASEKAREQKLSLVLYQQDMRSFVLAQQVDAIICFCDSLNYLTSSIDVQQTFGRVYEALMPGGKFLFDMHSLQKINHVFANHTFAYSDEDISYIWQCEHEGIDQVAHDLTIFVKEGELYRKFEELHVQKGYAQKEVVKWLGEAGFFDIQVSSEFGKKSAERKSERLFFSCTKPQRNNYC
jgi:SAM-dependent methyltransferase